MKEKRKEDSTGKYIISLKKENGDVVFSEILLNQDVYRTIEYLKNFPPVFVEGEEKFVLEISVSEDDADNRMGVCYYDLPIETYLDGELLFDDEKLQGDMMFNVYESKK